MSDPTLHRQPTTSTPTASTADPAWAAWSRAWTRHVKVLTGRDDLTVLVAPGAGGGAPACFYHHDRRIEIDATHIGSPDIADPRRAVHKRLAATGYGLLVHEAAHATHSRWHPPAGTAPVLAAVADLLEESRAEHRQRGRRRGDRRWLRHTVTTLLVTPDAAPVDDTWHAAWLAGLLLARVDGRVLTTRDVRAVKTEITTILGRQRLAELRDIWRQAHATGDTDADTMLELARRWCRTLDINPLLRPRRPVADPGVFPGRLAAALGALLAAAAGLTPAQYTDQQLAARHKAPGSWSRQDPTDQQRQAARRLAARLRQARTNHPEPAARPSLIPPGRLRTRHAITADAQTAAGQIPTAQPWQQPAALPPPRPRLHLGILVDLSGSMHPYTAPLSEAAWMFAHAARTADAVTATIGFANTVTLLIPPRQRPAQILAMRAGGGTTTFPQAVKLADQLLGLRHTRSLRLLAVVSDGDLADKTAAQKLITTLHHTGCPVLWLRPANLPGHSFTDTTTVQVADPVEAVEHIAQAVVAALARA